jgi:DNA modification methylase
MIWEILTGDCRDLLQHLPAKSVHTVVTSPPFFGLRDYNAAGQIGLEPTPDEFVQALVEVFRSVRRVLRDDGTVWLNLGDSYSTSPKGNPGALSAGLTNGGRNTAQANAHRGGVDTSKLPGVKPKDLLGIPWLVAFALRADGWYLRADIIWHKPNPMPESVTDRPTRAHEFIFLLTKSSRYFYDADAIRENDGGRPSGNGFVREHRVTYQNADGSPRGVEDEWTPGGRNKRDVWTVSTKPYAGAHFATFPPDLIEPCVLAGCPERACGVCGASWERMVERTDAGPQRQNYAAAEAGAVGRHRGLPERAGGFYNAAPRTLGFEPSCDCNADPAPGVVLDPFAGAGTTGLVAIRNRRAFIGLELNPEYAQLARDRIETDLRIGHRNPQRVDADPDQLDIFEALA